MSCVMCHPSTFTYYIYTYLLHIYIHRHKHVYVCMHVMCLCVCMLHIIGLIAFLQYTYKITLGFHITHVYCR